MFIKEYTPLQIQNNIIKQIYAEQQKQIDNVNVNILDFIDQFNILTATWSLSLWEKEYGLPVRNDLTIQERRGRLLAKKQSKSVFNRKMVESISNGYGCELIDFEEFPELYMFNVVVAASQAGRLLRMFKESINTYKPAHLNYTFTLEDRNKITLYTSQKAYSVIDADHEFYDDIYVADIDINKNVLSVIKTEISNNDYDVIDEEKEFGGVRKNDNE